MLAFSFFVHGPAQQQSGLYLVQMLYRYHQYHFIAILRPYPVDISPVLLTEQLSEARSLSPETGLLCDFPLLNVRHISVVE